MNGETVGYGMGDARARQQGFTGLNSTQWEMVRPVLQASLTSRFLSSLEKSEWTLRDYTNALAYISCYRCRWNSIPEEFPPTASVYHFNRMLRQRKLFRVIRALLGEGTPFGLEAGYKSGGRRDEWYHDHRADSRKCDACPNCAENSMICYKTRKQGSRIVRYYRCEACGHKRVWLDMPQGKGWQGLVPVPPCG